MVRLTFLRTIVIANVKHYIFLDKDTLHFVAIDAEYAAKYIDDLTKEVQIKLGAWVSFESFESLKDGIEDYLKHKDVPIEKDPEERHWEHVAAWNERFS